MVLKGERTDRLRRRPDTVRYFYLAVSNKTLHTGISWGGLKYVKDNHGVEQLFLADLVTGSVYAVAEDIKTFMQRWRLHYNKPDWDYAKEVGVK